MTAEIEWNGQFYCIWFLPVHKSYLTSFKFWFGICFVIARLSGAICWFYWEFLDVGFFKEFLMHSPGPKIYFIQFGNLHRMPLVWNDVPIVNKLKPRLCDACFQCLENTPWPQTQHVKFCGEPWFGFLTCPHVCASSHVMFSCLDNSTYSILGVLVHVGPQYFEGTSLSSGQRLWYYS